MFERQNISILLMVTILLCPLRCLTNASCNDLAAEPDSGERLSCCGNCQSNAIPASQSDDSVPRTPEKCPSGDCPCTDCLCGGAVGCTPIKFEFPKIICPKFMWISCVVPYISVARQSSAANGGSYLHSLFHADVRACLSCWLI